MTRTAGAAKSATAIRWTIFALLSFQVLILLIDNNQKHHVVNAFVITVSRGTTSVNQRNQFQHSPRRWTVNPLLSSSPFPSSFTLSGLQAHPHNNGGRSWKSSRRKKSKRQRNHPTPTGTGRRTSQPKPPATTTVLNSMMILSDKKRQSHFKNAMNEEFPWIPPAILDVCLSVLSESFASVAPKDLKTALQPGNFDTKIRPKIEQKVVTSLQKQSMIQSLPLSTNDKNKLLEYLVSMSLDYMLQDAQEALAAPTIKLQMLEREKKEIIKFMSFPQIVWYRLRYFPIQSFSLIVFIGWTSYVTWQLYGHLILSCKPPVPVGVAVASTTIIDNILKFATTIKTIVLKSWSQIFSSLSMIVSSAIFKTPQKKRFW